MSFCVMYRQGFARLGACVTVSGVADPASLSPRGDWRAPSDGNAAAWLDDLDHNVPRR